MGMVNRDAQAWVHAWNSHSMQLPEGGQRSPRDMFLFGMVEEGPRGIDAFLRRQPADEELSPAELEDFGVDWEARDDPALMQHLLENNPQDWENDNPFQPGPSRLSEVVVDPPEAGLSEDELRLFLSLLGRRVNMQTETMEGRRLIWVAALELAREIAESRARGDQNTVGST